MPVEEWLLKFPFKIRCIFNRQAYVADTLLCCTCILSFVAVVTCSSYSSINLLSTKYCTHAFALFACFISLFATCSVFTIKYYFYYYLSSSRTVKIGLISDSEHDLDVDMFVKFGYFQPGNSALWGSLPSFVCAAYSATTEHHAVHAVRRPPCLGLPHYPEYWQSGPCATRQGPSTQQGIRKYNPDFPLPVRPLSYLVELKSEMEDK